MRLLICSDEHSDVEYVHNLADEANKSDLLIFIGNLTNDSRTAKFFIDEILKLDVKVVIVLRGCDDSELLHSMKTNGVLLSGGFFEYNDLFLTEIGVKQGFLQKNLSLNDEKCVANNLLTLNQNIAKKGVQVNNLILLTLLPPKNTKLDKIGVIHTGSETVRNFIVEKQPLLVISETIASNAGIDKLGKTVLINPGNLKNGHFAVCNLGKKSGCYYVEKCVLKRLDFSHRY